LPMEQNVVEGGAAIITCFSANSTVWKHNGSIIKTSESYMVFKNNLIVLDVTFASWGYYSCFKREGNIAEFVGSSLLKISGENCHTTKTYSGKNCHVQ